MNSPAVAVDCRDGVMCKPIFFLNKIIDIFFLLFALIPLTTQLLKLSSAPKV